MAVGRFQIALLQVEQCQMVRVVQNGEAGFRRHRQVAPAFSSSP